MGIKAHFFCTWNSHKKTTCRFSKNNVSFYQKQRVVLSKTSCRFIKNNVSFYQKHRIVLSKTTARFSANNVLFFANKVLIRQPTDYQNKKISDIVKCPRDMMPP